MANKSRSTFLKRQTEMARQERQKVKQAKRLEAKAQKAEAGDVAPEVEVEDPDLAGIKLGPQSRQDEEEWEEAGTGR